MGLVEKIGRKLSPRSNDLPISSRPDGSSTATGAAIQHVPPHLVQTRHGFVHVDAARGQPGIAQTANVESKNDSLLANRNLKANENHAQASQIRHRQETQRHQCHEAQRHIPPKPSRANNIVPPTSRLMDNKIDTQRDSPNNTRISTVGPLRGEAPHIEASRGPPHALHKQPSVASSLHSCRSGRAYNVANQQGSYGDQRNRANTMPANSRRPVGMSTRRMEDSAYHAGFRDAVAQLERERQGRAPALSH